MTLKASNFFNLASFVATSRQQKTAATIGTIGFVLSFIILPYAYIPLKQVPTFIAIYVSCIVLISMLTAYLLYKHFRITSYYPLLILSATYVYIGAISIAHLFTFPAVFSPTGLGGAGTQTALWLWVVWHVGFPIGVLLYMYSVQTYRDIKLSRSASLLVYVVVFLLVGGVFLVTTKLHQLLPIIIEDGLYTSFMKYRVSSVICTFHAIALVLLLRKREVWTVLHVSLVLSVFLSFLDVIVTLFGEGRYTIGWYTARLNTIISLSVLSITFVYELNKLSDALAEQHERLWSLFHHNPDAVYSLSTEGIITDVNAMHDKLTGYTRADVIGTSILQCVFSRDDELAMQLLQRVSQQGETQHMELIALQRDGSEVDVAVTGIPIFVNEQVTGIFCIVKDITAQKAAQRKLEEANQMLRELSLRDGLTGLGNRRYLEEYVEEKWAACMQDKSPLGVILIDIDHFKAYNDEYGHMLGDHCLQAISGVLQQCIQPSRGLASRYGGEELCVVLPGVTAVQAEELAEHIRSEVEKLQIPHSRSQYGVVTISLGVFSELPEIDKSAHFFIDMADKALYQCKGIGKNCVASFSHMLEREQGLSK